MDIDSLNIEQLSKMTGKPPSGYSTLPCVKPESLQGFLAEQDQHKTRSVAFVDCQNSAGQFN